MNYSSIQDAWGSSDYITNQYKMYDKIIQNDPVEPFNNIENPNIKFQNNVFDNKLNNDMYSQGYNDQNQFLKSSNSYNNNFHNNNSYNNSHNNNSHNNQLPSYYNIHNNKLKNNNHTDLNNIFICDDFWDHLNTCKTCRKKIREKFSSKIIEKLENLILDNKDTILIFLICLFALICCNLFISIFKH